MDTRPMKGLYDFDTPFLSGTAEGIIGTDEAGRGPLAGPVVAAAVKLDFNEPIEGINDSKLLSAQKRTLLYDAIIRRSPGWAVGIATVREIETLNILRASLLAMERAIKGLHVPWSVVLIDGNTSIGAFPPQCQRTVVKGDRKSASIAAASILAKVTRDTLMMQYHALFPRYGFDKHKGYATREHREHITRFGLCPIHRRSFCEGKLLQTRLGV